MLPARSTSRSPNPRHLSYNRDVRPILAENCFPCHGPDKAARKAGLRLDREEIAKGTLASGTVPVVAGAPDKSALVARLLHADEERRMPLAKSGRARLSSEQIATLRRWIAEGAEWEPHWAYIPPVRPTPPATRDSRWARNAVDAFILAGVEKAGLRPSPEAPRAQLVRRLSFDLTGLPPTPEEVRAFETDTRKDAYERQVDRLLASPRFGERMALFWLDLVRYSDSVGYHSDNARPMWRYRDWVVQAWNANLPFDRFTAEQLAGDLLPGASDADRIASGYNRLLQTTEEGGAQPKEYRAIYLADRVRNASSVWMGATLGCAQCHDHKFDPYLQRDFYAFSAFFADINELPVGRRKPEVLPDAARKPALDSLDAKVKERKSALEAAEPTAEWEKARGAPCREVHDARASVATSANGTRVMIQGNDFSIIASTSNGPKPPRTPTPSASRPSSSGSRRCGSGRRPSRSSRAADRAATRRAASSSPRSRSATPRPLALRARRPPRPTATARPPRPRSTAIRRTAAGRCARRRRAHRLVVSSRRQSCARARPRRSRSSCAERGLLRTLGRLRLAGTSDALPVRTTPGPEPWSDRSKWPPSIRSAHSSSRPRSPSSTGAKRTSSHPRAPSCAPPSSSARRSSTRCRSPTSRRRRSPSPCACCRAATGSTTRARW